MSLKAYWHILEQTVCVTRYVSHQTNVGIQTRVYIIIFRQVLCTYFASLSSGLPILEHVFPREYSLNGYVPLNKVSFWTRSVLKIVMVGKKGLLLC